MEKLLMWFQFDRDAGKPTIEAEVVANDHETFWLTLWDDATCEYVSPDSLSKDEGHRLMQKIDSEYKRRTRHLENNIFEHVSEHNREYVNWINGGSR